MVAVEVRHRERKVHHEVRRMALADVVRAAERHMALRLVQHMEVGD